MGAAQNALGEPPRAGRHVRYFTGRSEDTAREWPLFRNSALPLCDGFALAIAVLVAMPRWQALGYALVVLGVLSVNGAHRLGGIREGQEGNRRAKACTRPCVWLTGAAG